MSQGGPPASSGGGNVLKIVLVVLGLLGLGCVGVCGGCYWMATRAVREVEEAARKLQETGPKLAQHVVTRLEGNAKVTEHLGSPLQPQNPQVEAHVQGPVVDFDVTGPKGT